MRVENLSIKRNVSISRNNRLCFGWLKRRFPTVIIELNRRLLEALGNRFAEGVLLVGRNVEMRALYGLCRRSKYCVYDQRNYETLHHLSHEPCFIVNSIQSGVKVEVA